MKTDLALSGFAALSQEARLEAFRQLVGLAPEATPAGQLAHALDVPQSTLSSHLAILQRAGLVLVDLLCESRRRGGAQFDGYLLRSSSG